MLEPQKDISTKISLKETAHEILYISLLLVRTATDVSGSPAAKPGTFRLSGTLFTPSGPAPAR